MSMNETKVESNEDLEERLHFQKVINSFKAYKKHSISAIHKREEYLNKLPMEHQKLLRKHGYQETLDDLKQAVEKNYQIVCHILNDVDDIFENVQHNNTAQKSPGLKAVAILTTIGQSGNPEGPRDANRHQSTANRWPRSAA